MKYLRYIVYVLAVWLVSSCQEAGVPFGTVEYYPDFLWVSSNTTPVKKTFEFDFSQDAQNDKDAYAELQFVDNEGNPVSTDIMQVYDGSRLLEGNKIRVLSDVKVKELTFTFSPQAMDGKHQGYLKLVNHNLDRIESQQPNPGDQLDVLQWTLHYSKVMNPLAKVLMWILITIIVCLCIWFFVIRPILYPHFSKFTKSVLIEQNNAIVGQFNYSFKGARKVIFYDKKVKQAVWSKLFTGEIKTYVHPLFRNKLTFTPRKRNAAVLGSGYTASCNPIPRSGVATITNEQEKMKITLR